MKKSLIAVALVFSSLPFVAHGAEYQNTHATQHRSTHVTMSLDVYYADLNLGSQAGARKVLTRIKATARRVCGGQATGQNLEARLAFKSCVAGAVDGAVRQLNAPLVTALHTGRTAGPRYAYEAR